jgi:pantoate--beta-alanine ligase
MKLIRDMKEMQKLAQSTHRQGRRIGFVPTMGALHQGHLSLMEHLQNKCDLLVVSVYVNPTQFAPGEDLEKYPRNLQEDLAKCKDVGVDVVFAPADQQMYPPGFSTYVNVEKLTGVLCGASRPLHFRGVTTVVAKLFNIVKPDVTVFGQKDYQQAIVIKRMVADLNWETEILVAPIVRETDGLAMSSRNRHLSSEERDSALMLFQALTGAYQMIRDGERSAEKLKQAMRQIITSGHQNRIDYISVVDSETLQEVKNIKGDALLAVAVYAGQTRLIDNLLITNHDLT